jgi:prohibitin 2
VQPGERGVEVTLGKVSPVFKPQGFGFKTPFITTIVPVAIRQQTREVQAACYSSDLQQVNLNLRVLYRIPEASVVAIYQGYAGDPFDSLVAPRVQEALKEVTALQSAEQIVKNREEIKDKALAGARLKVGSLLVVEDVVIQNIDLSHELETAIEAKMVQEQEAAKAKFTQQKAQIEADTVVIKAKGDAESIRIRGEALKLTPAFIDLQIVEKWDGRAPLYVGGASGGVNMLLPAVDLKKNVAAP